MKPEVSLIMPAWRPRPEWLRDAVTSALDEQACEIELIVVDDGSDEPVAGLLKEVEDPRLRVLRVDHGGAYRARNAGVAASRGAYLRFVDADDVVAPGSTGRLVAIAREGAEVLAYGATMMCDEQLEPVRIASSDRDGWVADEVVEGGFDVYVVSILFPRDVVERAGGWEEKLFAVSGDWDFVLRAVELAPVRPLDEVVTRYRRHGTSMTKTADVAAGAAAGRLVLGRYFDRHPERRGSDLERRAYLRLHLDRARAHASYGERRHALAELRAAFRWDRLRTGNAAIRWGAERVRAVSSRAARLARPAPRRRA